MVADAGLRAAREPRRNNPPALPAGDMKMGIYRMYTGDDGQTHIEETTLAAHPELAEAVKATSITFRENEAGRFIDWHPAPRRQYVICLSGGIEIGLGDGSTHVFGPGDARLVEDTTGQGHTTKTVGDGPGITCTVPLAN